MRHQICIIGGDPSGWLLLRNAGVDADVLERLSRGYVLSRIRAGVPEQGLCDILRDADGGARMDAEGFVHDGTTITAHGTTVHIDFKRLIGKTVTIYGQTEVTRALYAALDRPGAPVFRKALGCGDL